MSGKSTPGPWIRSKHGSQILTADGEQNIALVSIPILFTDEQHEEVLANACLLAAAPDLLAALERIADDYHRFGMIEPETIIEVVSPAIAKAEGRS